VPFATAPRRSYRTTLAIGIIADGCVGRPWLAQTGPAAFHRFCSGKADGGITAGKFTDQQKELSLGAYLTGPFTVRHFSLVRLLRYVYLINLPIAKH
jgi:hypothetical protein